MGKPTGNERKGRLLRSRKTAIGAGVSLLAAAMIFASGLSAQTRNADIGEIVVHNEGTMATFAGGSAKSGGRIHVRIDGPDGSNVFESSSGTGLVDWFLESELPDGRYTYDVWFTGTAFPAYEKSPAFSGVEDAIHETASMADEENAMGTPTLYKSGIFLIEGGVLAPQEQVKLLPGDELSSSRSQPSILEHALGSILNFMVPAAKADQIIADDVTIQDTSPCLRFEDTSEAGVDWDMCGFDELFGIFDRDTSGYTFRLDDGAPANSIFVEASTGDVGFGTATPATRLEVVDTFPNISFVDSDNSNYDYELLNNAGIFFLTDRTTGAIPMNIQNNSGGFALTINSGNVGVGNFVSPAKQLHVRGTSADTLGQNNTMLQVENASGTKGARRMIELINNGSPLLVYKDTSNGAIWNMSPVGNTFAISLTGTGAQEFQMDGGGNLTIQGALTQNSKRSSKEGFGAVDADTVLAKLDQLAIEEWSYKHTPDSRHMSPMAEDFYATFGLGPKNGIAPTDLAGVALAAIKALKTETNRLEGEKELLKLENRELQRRLERIESRLGLSRD